MLNFEFLPTISLLLNGKDTPIIHRDLSWLQFNERVLEEARSDSNPLLERVKFLAISASNLDEFFMIRVSSIEHGLSARKRKLDFPEVKRLTKIRSTLLDGVRKFSQKQEDTLEEVTEDLFAHGICLNRGLKHGVPAHAVARVIFETQILPKLPPPESFTPESLNQLESLQTGVILPGALWIRIPKSLPTVFFHLSENNQRAHFFFLDDLIGSFLPLPVATDWKLTFVRLTRDGDYEHDLEDTDPESIPDVVRTRIRSREGGKPIRVQYSGNPTAEWLALVASALKLESDQFFTTNSTLYLHGLWTVFNQLPADFGDPDLRYPALQSKTPSPFDGTGNIFERIQQRDYLLHHPYDSFDAFVQFMREAAADPNVTRIEQTVYRMDAVSPVIGILKEAAKTKRVAVFIELRARFDELNNLRLADELQKAGVQVAYGFGKLKLHAKVALVTRNEAGGEKLYTHLSTGNYNAATARAYTDLAILTCHPDIGSDARHFLNSLYEGRVPSTFKQLLIAPTRMARRLIALIDAEAEAARQGKKARVVAKVNALVDEQIISKLYEASTAGVQVDLIVRGACSLVPGVKGLSENIRVVSIVDRFLEHSRIYYFESAAKMYLSSADWMPRNFFNRLEIAFPVLDERLFAYLKDVVLPAYLADTAKGKELTAHGTWKKRVAKDATRNLRSQVLFRELALRDYRGTPLQ